MAALSEDVKIFIIEHLACYDTPTEVAEAVKEEFDIEIDRNQVGTYNPTTIKGRELGKKWKAVFEAKRKTFLEDIATIDLANVSVRVRELQKNYRRLMKSKNIIAANQVLEQIAKETGGAFTNKIKLAGGDKNDEPIKHKSEIDLTVTPEEAYKKLINK